MIVVVAVMVNPEQLYEWHVHQYKRLYNILHTSSIFKWFIYCYCRCLSIIVISIATIQSFLVVLSSHSKYFARTLCWISRLRRSARETLHRCIMSFPPVLLYCTYSVQYRNSLPVSKLDDGIANDELYGKNVLFCRETSSYLFVVLVRRTCTVPWSGLLYDEVTKPSA